MIGAMVAHHGHWWFAFFPLLWISLIVLLFWRRGRWHHHHGWHGGPGGPSAEQVLGERYARGEITEEEYRQRRTVLRES